MLNKKLFFNKVLPYGIVKTKKGWSFFNRDYQNLGDFHLIQFGPTEEKEFNFYFDIHPKQLNKIKSLSTGGIEDEKIFFYKDRIDLEKYNKLIAYLFGL